MPDGEFDVFIHAGDMGNMGAYREYATIGKWFRKHRDQFRYQIIVPGNHDFGFMTDANLIMQDHFDKDVILLIDKSVEIDGFKFYGCPWMPEFMGWAFMREEDDLEPYYDAIPDDTQVLITHSPPIGILDETSPEYGVHRCGSYNLRERIKNLHKLTHHIFGHIHHSYGQKVVNGTSFHNVAALNERYRYHNPPQVIEIRK